MPTPLSGSGGFVYEAVVPPSDLPGEPGVELTRGEMTITLSESGTVTLSFPGETHRVGLCQSDGSITIRPPAGLVSIQILQREKDEDYL